MSPWKELRQLGAAGCLEPEARDFEFGREPVNWIQIQTQLLKDGGTIDYLNNPKLVHAQSQRQLARRISSRRKWRTATAPEEEGARRGGSGGRRRPRPRGRARTEGAGGGRRRSRGAGWRRRRPGAAPGTATPAGPRWPPCGGARRSAG